MPSHLRSGDSAVCSQAAHRWATLYVWKTEFVMIVVCQHNK